MHMIHLKISRKFELCNEIFKKPRGRTYGERSDAAQQMSDDAALSSGGLLVAWLQLLWSANPRRTRDEPGWEVACLFSFSILSQSHQLIPRSVSFGLNCPTGPAQSSHFLYQLQRQIAFTIKSAEHICTLQSFLLRSSLQNGIISTEWLQSFPIFVHRVW